MHGLNQKANWLQSLCGIFLHAANAPQKVMDVLSRMGISVAPATVYNSLQSLSAHAEEEIREIGQTLTAAYTYDNFDIDFKPSVPTREKSGETLKHFTSAFVFPLQHVTAEDLNCSEYLWNHSRLNIRPPLDMPPLPQPTWRDVLKLHAQTHVLDEKGMTARDRFNSWKLLHDLCHYGPVEFRVYCSELGEPESLEKIPVQKTPITPLRSTTDNNSQVSGNVDAIYHILEQAGVGDPSTQASTSHRPRKFVVDISGHVIIIFGDLGTGDRIDGGQRRRSIERTPWRRLQFIIFVLGLFHFKMACVDAIWRIFISPVAARHDDTCLMKDVSILRPRETGIIGSKPGFRRMHQIIQQSGICRRLDCWRTEALQRNASHTSLEAFAASKPSLTYLKEMADYIALNYMVASRHGRLQDLRNQATAARDQQFENNLLLNEYCLLYEETTHAMNQGDIGRVESCFIPWVWIFKATGKHKYAKHVMKYLQDVHFLYPAGLRYVMMLLSWL